MSWFWGKPRTSHEDGKDDAGKVTREGDPVRKLDPKLKNYLANEAPSNYNALATSEPASPALPYRKQAPVSATSQPWAETGVPQKSLYQDGRYKELWKTYKPLEEIENATKTDQDRLLDIVAGLKERKTQISRAALENCSFEQTLVSDCFSFGGWKSRMTMCRAENKAFERCYVTQAKFLKALGYLSTYERPPEVDEQIQMHADKLYHQMLRQERAIEKARAEGKPLPTLEDLIPASALSRVPSAIHPSVMTPSANLETSSSSPSQAASSDPDGKHLPTIASPSSDQAPPQKRYTVPDEFTEAAQAALDERLKNVPESEREVEAKAFVAEIASTQHTLQRVNEHRRQQEEGIARRRAKGQETLSDKIITIFRF